MKKRSKETEKQKSKAVRRGLEHQPSTCLYLGLISYVVTFFSYSHTYTHLCPNIYSFYFWKYIHACCLRLLWPNAQTNRKTAIWKQKGNLVRLIRMFLFSFCRFHSHICIYTWYYVTGIATAPPTITTAMRTSLTTTSSS